MSEKPGIVIGAFYETPEGRIARTHGWDGPARTVAHALDDGAGARSVGEEEFLSGWTRRADLSDFPDARDPVLPPVFDLLWDVKHRSGLVALLSDSEDEDEIRRLVLDNGIVLTETESAAVERLRASRTNDESMGMGR